MSLDKSIKHGKDWRKSYKERGKPGEYDITCRPHGAGNGWPCPWCENNRLHASKSRVDAVVKLQEY